MEMVLVSQGRGEAEWKSPITQRESKFHGLQPYILNVKPRYSSHAETEIKGSAQKCLDLHVVKRTFSWFKAIAGEWLDIHEHHQYLLRHISAPISP